MGGALWIVGWVFVCALGVLITGAMRFRGLRRRVGSFDCNLRRSPGTAWTQGIAHYGVGRIDWWRAHTLAMRPERIWPRHELVILGREDFGESACLVRCACAGEEFTLWMSKDAYAGLASWLEAAPPQRRFVL